MLVGRSRELVALGDLLDSGRPAMLIGEPGIGKTSLARQTLSERGAWRESGALATLARSPLFVFRRLLGGRLPDSPEGVAAEVVRSSKAPLLLDDLQWGDDSTLDAVAHLVGRVALVATVRTGEDRSDVVSEALALAGFETIALRGLDAAAAESYVRHAQPDLDERGRQELLVAAAGNPLLLGELRIAESGPPGLISALIARMSKVDEPGRVALEYLAVLGRPVAVDEFGDEVGNGAAAAVASGLAVVVDGHLEVRHALLGEVIVDLLGSRADEIRRALAPHVLPAEAARLLATADDRSAARRLALREVAGDEVDRQTRAELLALAVQNAPPGDLDVATVFERPGSSPN